ncbi:hypothetical protein NL676_007029 [Syzygium grande]|nr:hypothetical protein NL676_007029 [Syzygium grande]
MVGMWSSHILSSMPRGHGCGRCGRDGLRSNGLREVLQDVAWWRSGCTARRQGLQSMVNHTARGTTERCRAASNVAIGEDKYTEQVQRLMEEVGGLFNSETNQVANLEFIDTVQRLGLGYNFQTEIKNALSSIYNNTGDAQLQDDPYAASLRFGYSNNMDTMYSKVVATY